MDEIYIKTPIGILKIIADKQAVYEINFAKHYKDTQSKNDVLNLCVDEINRYFNGDLKTFTTPIFLKETDFKIKVYHEIAKIPYGMTATYKQIAQNIGHNNAFRAVGNANATNKIPIIIPCHRVVSTNGLGGYSGGDGVKTKEFLLNFEQKYR
ncbi:O6-alkylguanine-DNA-alkyltransferase [Campylobacter pinnipediorum subsp. pinnipediorum]|uniref:methylated-DNA--[protein]-cysteine S-methyltransferase n=1 Tax=Campylobacter pinnipediorum TaxID=1965231 RepID=UPI000994C55C|nr:methylated-DNA--[protein]-cysteine S-methyltransferase [Campylobacter pinnipediorum]AQW83890.1 O6-alkylguanine-DNA-alkyltransferase [Campylobacter pinnipediorum subsp. pinnipediorum]